MGQQKQRCTSSHVPSSFSFTFKKTSSYSFTQARRRALNNLTNTQVLIRPLSVGAPLNAVEVWKSRLLLLFSDEGGGGGGATKSKNPRSKKHTHNRCYVPCNVEFLNKEFCFYFLSF
jgi:hypothetical protein